MGLNLVVLCGRIATTPELDSFDSGASRLRLLLAVRSDVPRRRLDFIPVVIWKPSEELIDLTANERVWVSACSSGAAGWMKEVGETRCR